MIDELNVLGIMNAISIFDRLRHALASRAAIEVGKIGGDADKASARVLRLTDGAARKWWVTDRLRSMPLLERAAWMASLMPSILQREFQAHDFHHESQAKHQLIQSIARAMVAVENHATTLWFFRSEYIPYGDFAPAIKAHIAVAGPSTLTSYLIASCVKELQFLPADQYARLLHEYGVTGRSFMTPDQEYIAHRMDPESLVNVTLQAFMLGHELAIRDPSLDEQSREADLKFSPPDLRQLAFYGRHNFTHIDLVEEFSHGSRQQSNPHRSIEVDSVHEDRASAGPAPGLDAPCADSAGPALSITGSSA